MPALHRLLFFACLFVCVALQSRGAAIAQQASNDNAQQATPAKIVFVAGKPSHPPGMHEFNAGVQLLSNCLKQQPGVEARFVLNGWPEDEAIFDDAAAVIFYMDGNKKHEVVQQEGRRLRMIDEWTKRGVGIGCMHYGVEVVPEQAGPDFKRWIGGYYEHLFSCNPIWEPQFASFPDHPVSRGVKPFQIQDEWYFNMRFIADLSGNAPAKVQGTQFVPILVATPGDDVRDGDYVYPKGPYEHILANASRAEAMMWVVQRPDGGRGMGFTGGHFHKNWANDDFRKVVLNACLWLAKVEVPQSGVESGVSQLEIQSNLDPK